MKKLVMICAGIALLAACKKKDDDKSRTEHLTNGKWYGQSDYYYYKVTDSLGNVLTSTDTTYLPEDCEKDNYILFNANGTATMDVGALKCDPSESQTENGKWKLVDNDTKIWLEDEDGDGYYSNVKELNGGSFVMSYDTSYSYMGYNVVSKSETRFKH